jgi:hypothetical protein
VVPVSEQRPLAASTIVTGDGLVAQPTTETAARLAPVVGTVGAHVITGVPLPMVIVSDARVAAFQFAFDTWSARTVQTPAAM